MSANMKRYAARAWHGPEASGRGARVVRYIDLITVDGEVEAEIMRRRADYRKAVQSRHWRALRERRKYETSNCCERCYRRGTPRYGGRVLQLHHLTYDRLGQEHDADVILLCEECHRDEHGIAA